MIKSTKLFFATIFFVVFATASWAQDCVRINAVAPENNFIAITNLGSETADYSAHRFCSLFSYTNSGIAAETIAISGDIGAIPAGGTIVVQWPIDDNAADLSIYLPTGSFGDGNNMLDFVQYGGSGLGRESEAASVGLWTAGDFVDNNGNSMVWNGDCSSTGVDAWTAVGIEEFDQLNTSIYPNPVSEELVIELNEAIQGELEIEVYNNIGAVVEKMVFNNTGEQLRLDASNWPSGIFTIMLRTVEKSSVKNLIKL